MNKEKDKIRNGEEPRLVLILGGPGVGKTRLRREKYSANFVNIDAGDIFIMLSMGGYYDFPSHLEGEMENIGQKLMLKALSNKSDMVLELQGGSYKKLQELMNLAQKLGYKCELEMLQCDLNLAWERNIGRGDNNISSHYYEKYHFKWFKTAAKELLKDLQNQ